MEIQRIQNNSMPQLSAKSVAPQAKKSFDEQLAPKTGIHTQNNAANPEEVLTPSEKAYFERLYPASVELVRAYTPYRKDGGQQVAVVGTLVDRKG